jgi:hypothetical protein
MMLDLVVIVNVGLMIVSRLKQMHRKLKSGIPSFSRSRLIGSDSSSQDSLRKRIQRIETLLHGRQPSTEPQHSISSALAGIEKLLGIPPPETEQRNTILMPLLIDTSSSPTTLPSPAGSQSSQLRQAFLAEANHKRWGAESSIGQSWSKVRPLCMVVDIDLCDGPTITDPFQHSGPSWSRRTTQTSRDSATGIGRLSRAGLRDAIVRCILRIRESNT